MKSAPKKQPYSNGVARHTWRKIGTQRLYRWTQGLPTTHHNLQKGQVYVAFCRGYQKRGCVQCAICCNQGGALPKCSFQRGPNLHTTLHRNFAWRVKCLENYFAIVWQGDKLDKLSKINIKVSVVYVCYGHFFSLRPLIAPVWLCKPTFCCKKCTLMLRVHFVCCF